METVEKIKTQAQTFRCVPQDVMSKEFYNKSDIESRVKDIVNDNVYSPFHVNVGVYSIAMQLLDHMSQKTWENTQS